MTYYKVLAEDGTPCNGGTGKWNLPHDGQPGEWMPEIAGLVPCKRGYHVCTAEQLVRWFGPTIYEVECGGEHVEQADKHVFGRARLIRKLDAWTERTARMFACDCAERVLPIYERDYPGDARPRTAIEVARRYADGNATQEELDAAEAAAGAVARAAEWGTAWVAAWAAAGAAAGAAVEVAAGAAAWATAWAAAARDAECTWQTQHLCELLGIAPAGESEEG